MNPILIVEAPKIIDLNNSLLPEYERRCVCHGVGWLETSLLRIIKDMLLVWPSILFAWKRRLIIYEDFLDKFSLTRYNGINLIEKHFEMESSQGDFSRESTFGESR